MSATVILAAVELITLHMIDGRVVQINPQQVTQVISGRPAGDASKSFPEAVQCVVRFTDGSFLSVAEDCATVRELMRQPKENAK